MSLQPDKESTVNREELIRALRLIFHEGDVFEIRVLNATRFDRQTPHTESGYYDYDHIPQAAEAIAKLRSYTGAYVTLNPVDPDLLARSFNHLSFAKNSSATSDADILRRRWLLIDCDPIRKSNISSTEEEHMAALCLADEIRVTLTSEGWPEPITLDSGNGAHMLYRVDLPAEDNGLVKQVITAIAEASTDKD